MKFKTMLLIGGLIFGGMLVASQFIEQDQTQSSTPRTISGAEWNALSDYAHRSMSRAIVVNDTALDFTLDGPTSEAIYITSEGYPTNPAVRPAVAVAFQYTVSFTGFEGGAILDVTNAILDVEHKCIIFYHLGAYVALVLE